MTLGARRTLTPATYAVKPGFDTPSGRREPFGCSLFSDLALQRGRGVKIGMCVNAGGQNGAEEYIAR